MKNIELQIDCDCDRCRIALFFVAYRFWRHGIANVVKVDLCDQYQKLYVRASVLQMEFQLMSYEGTQAAILSVCAQCLQTLSL